MVFPIVSTHIRKNDKLTKSGWLLSTALVALSCLSACGTQDDVSAPLNPAAANESAENKKNVKVENGSANAGREIFERSNCAMCHPGGNNTMDPGHPIKGPDFARKYAEDAVLESTIRKGFPDVGMPSYSKKQIDEQEMKNLIAYVRSLTAPSKLSPQTTKSHAVKSH
jgi:mono/diheme cytochrome c family protein